MRLTMRKPREASSTEVSRATVCVIRMDEELMAGARCARLTLLFVGVARFIALGHGCFLPLGVPLWIQCATPLHFFLIIVEGFDQATATILVLIFWGRRFFRNQQRGEHLLWQREKAPPKNVVKGFNHWGSPAHLSHQRSNRNKRASRLFRPRKQSRMISAAMRLKVMPFPP